MFDPTRFAAVSICQDAAIDLTLSEFAAVHTAIVGELVSPLSFVRHIYMLYELWCMMLYICQAAWGTRKLNIHEVVFTPPLRPLLLVLLRSFS
jgi:hypothetical protein